MKFLSPAFFFALLFCTDEMVFLWWIDQNFFIDMNCLSYLILEEIRNTSEKEEFNDAIKVGD